MFCASISADWDFSVNLLRSILLVYLTSALPNVYYDHIATSQSLWAGKSSEKWFETARRRNAQGWRAIDAPSDSAHEILPDAPAYARASTSWIKRTSSRTRAAAYCARLSSSRVLVFEQHDQRRSQATATSRCLGLAFSLFDRCTVSMPSLNSAFTFSGSASSGSVKRRIKLPYARSTR